jgi:hypothetical protein
MYAGMILILIGALIWFFHDKLGWFGHLPGDIRIKKENYSFYFPLTTMIIISVVVSLIIWLISKFRS